jgi:hypothetical protein
VKDHKTNKFKPNWYGPWIVTKVTPTVLGLMDPLSRKEDKVHRNYIKPYFTKVVTQPKVLDFPDDSLPTDQDIIPAVKFFPDDHPSDEVWLEVDNDGFDNLQYLTPDNNVADDMSGTGPSLKSTVAQPTRFQPARAVKDIGKRILDTFRQRTPLTDPKFTPAVAPKDPPAVQTGPARPGSLPKSGIPRPATRSQTRTEVTVVPTNLPSTSQGNLPTETPRFVVPPPAPGKPRRRNPEEITREESRKYLAGPAPSKRQLPKGLRPVKPTVQFADPPTALDQKRLATKLRQQKLRDEKLRKQRSQSRFTTTGSWQTQPHVNQNP